MPMRRPSGGSADQKASTPSLVGGSAMPASGISRVFRARTAFDPRATTRSPRSASASDASRPSRAARAKSRVTPSPVMNRISSNPPAITAAMKSDTGRGSAGSVIASMGQRSTTAPPVSSSAASFSNSRPSATATSGESMGAIPARPSGEVNG